MRTKKMEGKSQKREVRALKADGGEPGQNPEGSTDGVIHPTSGKENLIHNDLELMEQLVERSNMIKAYRKVVSNKGAAGVDGISTDDLKDYVKEHWGGIKEELLAGTYKPQPVRRVEIPKPNGGVRKLGIPTVMDRLIQQAISQILTSIFEPIFSENSFGFRPGRSAHQAINKAKEYIREGKRWVVDMDLEKFFDRVNHDILIERVRRKVSDTRIISLIRRYLKAGIMEHGITKANEEGTPQGGALSPLLSNIMLTDMDNELERRGHSFCRYADDCNIYVSSEKAGQRVFESMTKYLEKKLKLQINRTKSSVDRPWKCKFLGFSFTSRKVGQSRVHGDSIEKFRCKIKDLCRIGRGWNLNRFIQKKLNPVLNGWINYFKHADTYSYAKELDAWIRRRLRTLMWRQWGRIKVRYRKLAAAGIKASWCYGIACCSYGPWRINGYAKIGEAFPPAYFEEAGLISMYQKISDR